MQIVKFCNSLSANEERSVFADQLMRSGTIIGALAIHLEYEDTQETFLAKIAEALKEVQETSYWLQLISGTQNLPQEQFEWILASLAEIKQMLEFLNGANKFTSNDM